MNFNNRIVPTLLFVVLGSALYASSNIRATKHNLTLQSSDNEEMCVFCHTPSGSNSGYSSGQSWNKGAKNNAFKIYGTSESDDSNINPSLACLSCHDGISAINILTKEFGPDAMMATMGSANAFTMGLVKSNNHPISVIYREGIASLKSTSSPLHGWSGGNMISDLLRNNRVECGSCHDPHEATNGTFLRVSNSDGGLCKGCHGK